MKLIKIILFSATILLTSLVMVGCENTSVSGSVSYGMGMGYGYPMYYGNGGYRHGGIIVARPPGRGWSRPHRPRRY